MSAARPDTQRDVFHTKLVVPRSPPGMVPRERLLDCLDHGTRGSLTLVSAPAGSGKTALLAWWLEHRPRRRRVAWLSLGREERDRERFWIGVTAALRDALGPGGAVTPSPRADVDAYLPHLFAALALPGEPVLLVLDDFHEVTDPGITEDIQTLLDHAPARLSLVLSTRADPVLRLQRLRMAGELTEIRARDLAFTKAEARLLEAELGLALSEADRELLHARTEGWAAGLRLAALSLAGHPDPHGFLESFAGDDRAVSDYLLSEVLARQSPETLDFLLRTSIVDRIGGELADALTGGEGGARALESLLHRGGMLSCLDDRGRWYRYHPLFAEVLRLELGRTMPEELPELHRRAARWHGDHAMPIEAMTHAIAAEDWDVAAEVAGASWLSLLLAGKAPVMRGLVLQIPDVVVRASAELALASGGLRLDAGEEDLADELVALALELAPALSGDRRRRLEVTSTATRLYRARLRGDVEETLSAARRVLSVRWEHGVAADVRALTLANLGIAELWAGETRLAREHLTQAIGVAIDCGNDYVLFMSQGWGAAADLRAGQIDSARQRADIALGLAEIRGWTATPQAAIGHVVLAALAIFGNDLETARSHAEAARAALHRSGERLLRISIARLEAQLLGASGEPLTGLDVLRGATADGGPIPAFLHVAIATLEAELLEAVGETAHARRVLVDLETSEDTPDAAVGLARLELIAGRPEEALGAVADFLADEREPVRVTSHVEAWVIAAIARDTLRDEERAMHAVERALDLAEPRGLRRPILRHGPAMRSLLRRHIRNGTAHRALAGELLAVLDDDVGRAAGSAEPLLEPLSDRELAVLRFLPTMMSNAEIASEMFVSVNTVKTHLKHVYRKLDVADRRDAIRRARELHLLSPSLSGR